MINNYIILYVLNFNYFLKYGYNLNELFIESFLWRGMKFMPVFLKYTDPKEGKNAFFTTYVLKDWNCQFQFNGGEGYV